MQTIIFPNDVGGIHVFCPMEDCLLPMQEIAHRVVPAGKPYKIVDSTEIPQDRIFRSAWEANFSNPDGIGGA